MYSTTRADRKLPEDAMGNHILSQLAKDMRNANPREFSLPIPMVPNDLEPTAPIGLGNAANPSEPQTLITSNNVKRQRVATYAATIAAAAQTAVPSSSSNGPATPGTNRRRAMIAAGSNYNHQLSVYHSSGPPPAKKPILQPDCSIVSLNPLVLCYVCNRSCRSAPLLQCDYCPLAFHLDCLETPLSTFPSTPWMCPNVCCLFFILNYVLPILFSILNIILMWLSNLNLVKVYASVLVYGDIFLQIQYQILMLLNFGS